MAGLPDITLKDYLSLVRERDGLREINKELLNACGRAVFHMNLRGWRTEGHELSDVYEQVLAAIRKAEG